VNILILVQNKNEHRLRMSENGVLRKLFGPKREKVTGVENNKHYDLYSLLKSRQMRCMGPVAHMGNKRSACRVLVGRPKCKRPLGRHRQRWVDNIKKYLQEVGWGVMVWIDLAQDRNR